METRKNQKEGLRQIMRILFVLCSVLTLIGCSKDNTPAPEPIDQPQSDSEPENLPPQTFDLIDLPDGAVNVEVTPTLSWETAVDPEGAAVTYDLIVDTQTTPITVYANNITNTFFEISERLGLYTDYFWKVVARDDKGNSTESTTYRFTVRGLMSNTQATITAAFPPRVDHTTTVFDNKLWVIGGSDIIPKNDVWYSSDGVNWTATSAGAFSARTGHTTAVFGGKLWLIGGWTLISGYKNDVWYSDDGVEWSETPSTVNFSARSGHTMAVFDNRLWVIGGHDGNTQKNDVWYSVDGATWVEATPAAPFSARNGHTTAVFDNRLWVIGGYDGNTQKNDVWYSNDGANWTEVTNSALFSARVGHTTAVFDNKLWVIGGWDGSLKNDVWYSKDGANWTATSAGTFSTRSGHTTAVFDDKLWLIGGFDGDAKNDAWAFD